MWSVLGRKPRASEAAGRALYAAAVEQARRPVFYRALGVSDSANGRFELYSLHVILLLRRLKAGGGGAGETAQVLFDVYISELDQALREQGVGDLSMAKTMRKLGEAFYGRVRSYDEAFDALPDPEPLRSLLARTLGEEGGDADGLSRYATAALEGLSQEDDATLLGGRAVWPGVEA